jgi:hypothetical protein
MPHEYEGTREYFLIYAELIQAARFRGTVTYQELAELVGLPPVGAFMGAELGAYLGAISQNEVEHGRPMLSAVTVTVDGKPGEGFFGLAKDLGRLAGDLPSHKETFWEAERQRVYATWHRYLHRS